MVQEIEWGDGSGQKLYLTYTAASGNQTVSITSDALAGYEPRSKDLVFSASAGGTTVTSTLRVTQTAKDITIVTFNDKAITRNDVAVGYE